MYKDEINNWYQFTDKTDTPKLDKNFKKHGIKPCQMISIIGQTGSGKSQAILELLSRKNDAFFRIILFSGSTTDEPLYRLLEKHISGIELIDDADKLPEFKETLDDDDGKCEKLIIFDDIINLPKKQLVKIQKWVNSSRKKHWTCISVAQNYTDLPIQIRRNTMIFILFRLNDTNSINQILKNHSNGDDINAIKQLYYEATAKPHNFFMLDTTSFDYKRYRHNFTDFLTI
jgi:ABC-type dipeptide/oligopeptide/nickel transport system ATPase component